MRKKILSLLLVISMLAAFGPIEIFATNIQESSEINEMNEEVLDESIQAQDSEDTIEDSTEIVEAPDTEAPETVVPEVNNLTLNYKKVSGSLQIIATWTTTATRCKVWRGSDVYSDAPEKYDVYGTPDGFGNYSYSREFIRNIKYSTYKIRIMPEGATTPTVESITIKDPRPYSVKTFKSYASYKSVVLKWSKVSNASGYLIYRYNSAKKKYVLIKTIKSRSTLKYVCPAAADKTYTYKIYAYKDTTSNKSTNYKKTKNGAVRTMHLRVTFSYSKTLTSHDGKIFTHKFPKGYVATTVGFADGKYQFYYKGGLFYVARISIKNPRVYTYSSSKTYTKREAEYFINKRGLSSNTKYLVWINTYTQREYIFKGSKGKWDCIYSWEVSTGKPSTPTKTGACQMSYKVPERNHLHYWSLCSQFSIHSKANSWKLGYPRSGGCARNTKEHAYWIYKNCPIGTRVLVF